jgi:hypothetical protein
MKRASAHDDDEAVVQRRELVLCSQAKPMVELPKVTNNPAPAAK